MISRNNPRENLPIVPISETVGSAPVGHGGDNMSSDTHLSPAELAALHWLANTSVVDIVAWCAAHDVDFDLITNENGMLADGWSAAVMAAYAAHLDPRDIPDC